MQKKTGQILSDLLFLFRQQILGCNNPLIPITVIIVSAGRLFLRFLLGHLAKAELLFADGHIFLTMGTADTAATSPFTAVSVVFVESATSFIPAFVALLSVHSLFMPRGSRQMLYAHQNTSLYEQK